MGELYFRAKAYRRVTKTTPRPDAEAGPYTEPASAADWAEDWLLNNGIPDESFVDLYFNGEAHIHTSLYLVMEGKFKTIASLNTSHAKWPITYPDGGGITLYPGNEPFGRDTEEWVPGDSDEDEISDDGDKLDITDIMEGNDDENGDDEDYDDDEDENGDDDSDDEDEGKDENEDDDGKDKKEVPRMTIFGKFKGPKGWRKRAETDSERDTNTFAVKFGVLDSTRYTSAQQERNSRVEIRFIERDSRRDAGELRIRIPEGVTIRDEGKWLVAEIPYVDAPRENGE